MASIIRVDGTVEDIGWAPSLEQLQDAVGGNIEFVAIHPTWQVITGWDYMYCNDIGKLEGLQFNPIATGMMMSDWDVVVGDVVVCKIAEDEEE